MHQGTYQVGNHNLGFAAGSRGCGGSGNSLVLLVLTGGLVNTADGGLGGGWASGTTACATTASSRGASRLENVIKRLVEFSGRHLDGLVYESVGLN